MTFYYLKNAQTISFMWLKRMEILGNRISWMGWRKVRKGLWPSCLSSSRSAVTLRASASRATSLKFCSQVGVSHCKGVCLFFSSRRQLQRAFFCFGFPLGNIKAENKGNSEPLFFTCHRSLSRLSRFRGASDLLLCMPTATSDLVGGPTAAPPSRTGGRRSFLGAGKELSKAKQCYQRPEQVLRAGSLLGFLVLNLGSVTS